MRISNLIQQDRLVTIENRKKVMQRKEAGDAYRKNAQYFQPKKNPILEELENLLLGHKDLELYEKNKESNVEMNELTAAIQEIQQTEQNVRAHKGVDGTEPILITQTPDSEVNQHLVDEDTSKKTLLRTSEDQTIQILESVKSAALAPVDPSTQDLRIAASADVQIQKVKAKIDGNEDYLLNVDEEPAFVREPIEVSVPQRFAKELKLDPIGDTIFGKSFENAYKARIYQHAKSVYVTQTEMAKSGYLFGNEGSFSWIA